MVAAVIRASLSSVEFSGDGAHYAWFDLLKLVLTPSYADSYDDIRAKSVRGLQQSHLTLFPHGKTANVQGSLAQLEVRYEKTARFSIRLLQSTRLNRFCSLLNRPLPGFNWVKQICNRNVHDGDGATNRY